MYVNEKEGVTLLWALRSPCHLRCRYCYFGTVDEDKSRLGSLDPGQLSHLSRSDVELSVVLGFAATFSPATVRRVFLAGGEPLQWAGTRPLVDLLKHQGIEVIICTNGLPLIDKQQCDWLLGMDVEAVSISLDSHDPEYNDRWRPDPSGSGWHGVVDGINTMIRRRRELSATTKIGIYSVLTKRNVADLLDTARFVAQLGVDYFIIQPVSLRTDHNLHRELCLNEDHHAILEKAIRILTEAGLRVSLPDKTYLKLFLRTLSNKPLPFIKACFGGRDLFFIEPDGSVWDCPSTYKIAETSDAHRSSIINRTAAELFSASQRSKNTDCGLFSQDCVNMWQLMAFDDLLGLGTT